MIVVEEFGITWNTFSVDQRRSAYLSLLIDQ